MKITSLLLSALLFSSFSVSANAHDDQLSHGRDAIDSLTGCFLIDYSYSETESLMAGYNRDGRVYDVNKTQSVKEWIYAEEISQNRVRLQHILFSTDLAGKFMDGSILKHQVEDWEYNASFLYDFSGPATWMVKDLKNQTGLWTRKITNLDDGLRYQCASKWSFDKKYPEWSCSNYAPIPGRETRDMGRKDYNTLDRSTRIVAYGSSWLERQQNVKTIDKNGTRTPLAKELGKNWYVRLPDSDCDVAMVFSSPRQEFWNLLRETWDEVLIGDRPFIEKTLAGQPPRFSKMNEIEEEFLKKDLKDPMNRKSAKDAILKTISDYRSN